MGDHNTCPSCGRHPLGTPGPGCEDPTFNHAAEADSAYDFDRRAEIARGAVPGDFGEGWMTATARDTVRIAAFAGFDVPELVRRIAVASDPDRMTNAGTVERVMGDMEAEANQRLAAQMKQTHKETP